VPIAVKLVSREVCEILNHSGWLYTVVPTWVYNVCNAGQRRTNAFRPTRWFAINRKHIPYYFAPDRAPEGWKGSVECNKTRSSSTGSDHKQSSTASDVLQNEPHFLIAMESKFVLAGETLMPCRRKIPCLEYVGRLAGTCACCFDWSQRVRYWESGNSCSGKEGKPAEISQRQPMPFKNGMCFAVSVILQLAGYCFRRKVLLFPKGLGMKRYSISEMKVP